MAIRSFALGLIAFLSLTSTASSQTFQGNFYQLTSTAKTWTDAEAEAISIGGHLTSILSEEEQAFIESTFLVGSFSTKPLWIGLNDAAVEGSFVWASGSPLIYTKWKDGEPNNFGGDEDYVAINWGTSRGDIGVIGQWNDTPNFGSSGFGGNTDGLYFGIIKSPVPEPYSSQLVILGLGVIGVAAWRRKV